MKFKTLILLLPLFFGIVHGGFSQERLALGESSKKIIVREPDEESWHSVKVAPLGASVLYFWDDDRAWQQPQTLQSIKSARVTTLRFPGGELADNYDWERHALERPKGWPGEATSDGERVARTDYLEFFGYAKALGVEDLFFVVNVDSAFRASGDQETNLKRYAEKAARWVKAVKAAGYHVRYWEVGNEPHHAGSYPLTAREYARALQVFSHEMRAADPTILIGAAGPHNPRSVAFADRLTPVQLKYLREHGGNRKKVCPKLTTSQCVEKLQNESPGRADGKAWWDTLLVQAKDSFDFAIIHRYAKVDLAVAAKRGGKFKFTESPQRLRTYLEYGKDRPVPIALTEWNTPNEKRHKSLTEIEHLLDIAVQLGNNAVGGVDFAHYWPLRSPGPGFKPLLTQEGEMTAVAKLFAMVGEMLLGAEVAQSLPGKGVYVLRTRQNGSEGVIVVNTTSRLEILDMDFADQKSATVIVQRMVGRGDGSVTYPVESVDETFRGDRLTFSAPSRSVTGVKVAYRKGTGVSASGNVK